MVTLPTLGNIHTEWHNRLSPKQTAKMTQILWYIRGQACTNISKKTQDFSKDYKLNDDTNDELGDGVNVDEMMDDLEQTSARIIDDISIFDPNNGENLQALTLLKIFDSQLIKTSLTRGINLIL
ncbi:hypothetical protein C1645_811679 [Glomus cerebriforme]|uniref:Uncharacterized protein n=1 Tax=Glomus cerebriforme TaxID=658196 RepID=A0A397TML6_9GLOM|nr:hypothetical protein C1645_811679 [Glomus cerebriforme]